MYGPSSLTFNSFHLIVFFFFFLFSRSFRPLFLHWKHSLIKSANRRPSTIEGALGERWGSDIIINVIIIIIVHQFCVCVCVCVFHSTADKQIDQAKKERERERERETELGAVARVARSDDGSPVSPGRLTWRPPTHRHCGGVVVYAVLPFSLLNV